MCVQVCIGVGRRVGQVVGLIGDLCCGQWGRHLRIRVVTDINLGNLNIGEDGYQQQALTEGNDKGSIARPLTKRVCGG